MFRFTRWLDRLHIDTNRAEVIWCVISRDVETTRDIPFVQTGIQLMRVPTFVRYFVVS